jgi:hypothetical protein
LATAEDSDACFNFGVKRIKSIDKEGLGEGWNPFTVVMWLKDLNRGYWYKFEKDGILEDSKIVTGKPPEATAVVYMSSDDWVGHHTKEVSLADKYFSGEMQVKGDVVVLQQYQTYDSYEPYYPPGHPKHTK